MKRLILNITILTLLLSSCVPFQAVKSTAFIDFSKYEDFYISQSPNVNFDFKPLGIVSSLTVSGNEKKNPKDYDNKTSKRNKIFSNDVYETPETYGDYVYHKATEQEAIDLLIERAKSIGANGIINVKVEYNPIVDSKIVYSGYSASGMAIVK